MLKQTQFHILLLIFLSCISEIKAQLKFDIRGKVDLIAYDEEGNFTFLKKVGDSYRELIFSFDTLSIKNSIINKNISKEKANFNQYTKLIPRAELSDTLYSWQEISKELPLKVIPSNLRKTTIEDFIDKSFKLTASWTKDDYDDPAILRYSKRQLNRLGIDVDAEEIIKYVIRFLNKQIIIYQTLEFDSSYDEGWQWQSNDKSYNVLLLTWDEGKEIYAMIDRNDKIRGLFLPHRSGNIAIIEGEGSSKMRCISSSMYDLDVDLNGFKTLYYDEKGRYSIVGKSGENLLQDTYEALLNDETEFDYGGYTIGKHKRSADVYDVYLKRVPLGKVRGAYFYHYGNKKGRLDLVEVLNEKGVGYYDHRGKRVKVKPRRFSVCGTVPYTSFELSVKEGQHYLEVREGEFGYNREEEGLKPFILANIPLEVALTFAETATKTYYYDGNDYVLSNDKSSFNQRYIIAQKGNRYGLYEFRDPNESIRDTLSLSDKNDRRERMQEIFRPLSVNLKELLPIEQDKFYYEKGVLFFEKEGKIGIAPYQKSATYDKVKRVTPHFYRVWRNGKKGWVDVGTGEDYF